MPVDETKFIHITGMYKSGTSWLSHILSAHPDIIGWREFDIIRATRTERVAPLLRRFATRYQSIRKLHPGLEQETSFGIKDKQAVIRDIFCGRGWIPLMGKEARKLAREIDQSDSGSFIDELMHLAGKDGLARDNRPLLRAECYTGTLGFGNSTRLALTDLLDTIKESDDMSQVPHFFFEYLQGQCEPGTRISLKAADQVMCLRQLEQVSPQSRKIAIVRDGRDATISATHYGELMRKWDTPWIPARRSFTSQLRSWAQRIRLLSDYARDHNILILRYEDLKRDFFGMTNALFNALDIPTSQGQLLQIHQRTDFSTVTQGRSPGQAAEHIVRKGVIGEWTSVLSDRDAELAWKVAGAELERYGYTRNGGYIDGANEQLLQARR